MNAATKTPCPSCPYRRDCPSGVWAFKEYESLRLYDANESIAKFMCHSDPAKLCRGWLSVHAESLAVRVLTRVRGSVSEEEVYANPPVPLFASGNQAADHGQRQIQRPGKKARRMIEKITAVRTRKGMPVEFG